MEDNSEPGVKFDNIGFAAFMNKSKEPWFSANTFYSLSVPMVLDDLEGENIQNNYRAYAFGKRHTHGGVDAGWDVQQSHLCNETPGNSYTEWVEKMGYGKEFAKDWAAEFGKGSPCSSYANEKLPIADLGTRISALPENMENCFYGWSPVRYNSL